MRSAIPLAPRSRAAPRPAALAAFLLTLLLAACSGGTTTVFEGESEFGRVRVVERADGLRTLYTGPGRARQSAVFPGRPTHLELAYTRVAMLGPALAPPDGRILFVGLGGGAMPMYTRAVLPEARLEVVEIDPLIAEVAQRYFGVRPDERLVLHTADGRAFLEEAPPGRYDVIVLDAFSDDRIPYALTTRQFLETVRSRLAPDGVVVSNLWGSSREYPSMLATYDAVFDQVHLVRVGRWVQRIVVAGPAERRLDREALVEAARGLAPGEEPGFDLPALVVAGYEGSPAAGAPVLEDR
jgi:spermidine synthase